MTGPDEARALYLDLMKRCLVNWPYGDVEEAPFVPRGRLLRKLAGFLSRRGIRLRRHQPFDPAVRAEGGDHPPTAHTMIGLRRLDHLQGCVEEVLDRGIPGDLIEAGVWRGGACILMRAVLKAHGVADRAVWVTDSFAGLPPPDPARYPADAGDYHHLLPEMAVPLEEVRLNFERYGLLDGQVRFLEGWFRDSLPAAPFGTLALARLDGDMYGSTLEALTHLYPRLSPGGWLIVDDYDAVPACNKAVHDFRERHGIRGEMLRIPGSPAGICWRRPG